MLTRRLSLLTALLLLATAARLFAIQAQSIWFDEGWSAYAAVQPTLLAAWDADATNPPLYYVLVNISARFFGHSEFALRYVSLLLGLLTIPLVFRLARSSAPAAYRERAGFCAALLATASAPLWWASQEARMYTLLAVLILVCALAWQRLRLRPRRAAWVALWLAELALLYAHNTGLVAALWLNAVTVLSWLTPRRVNPRLWLVGQVGVGLLWLPYFVSRFLLLQGANSAITSAPQLGAGLLAQVWLGLLIAPWALALSEVPLLLVLAGLAALVLLFIFARQIALDRRLPWLPLHFAILSVGLIAGLVVLGNELHGRYLVMVVPLLAAWLGVGIARLRQPVLRYAAVAPFLLIFGVSLLEAQNPLYQHDDVRGMVRYYAERLTAQDTVIAWSYADRYDLAYYWDRMGVQARRITLPEGADLDAVLPLLPTSGDVALNVWYTQRADYRGMLGCVLGDGTLNLPENFTTYGMSTLIFAAPGLNRLSLQPLNVPFSDTAGNAVARLEEIGQIEPAPPDEALCLPIRVSLLRDVQTELKAAVIVQNSLGWTVASADAIFATANQRTSSGAAAGETLTAYPLLRLPYGAPAGEYRVFLRLYDETAAASGYTPAPGAHTVAGRDLLVANWQALPGARWQQVTRPSELPNVRELTVSHDLTLLSDNLPLDGQIVTSGETLRLALLWQGVGALPPLELADETGAWRVPVPPQLEAPQPITLDWRSVQVPPSASSGSALLRLPDGTVLARYQVEALPMLTEAPEFAEPAAAEFVGLGELVGFTLSDPPYTAQNLPSFRLVWHAADAAPAADYTVTVQLLDEAGQVVAQSDQAPGARPTSGWRAGEYILDDHLLRFNDLEPQGAARLFVAVYDSQTGVRLPVARGGNGVTLFEGLLIETGTP